jgi:hypothetical protein
MFCNSPPNVVQHMGKSEAELSQATLQRSM